MSSSSLVFSKSQLLSPETGKEAGSSSHILLFGYGNIDRQDDGVAWHVLRSVAEALGQPLPVQPEDPLVEITPRITISFGLQLMPETAELISQYERVCFIDAHTGRVDEPIHLEDIRPQFVNSPFTHHLTPHTCLSLAQTLYGRAPQAILASVRGYEFGFSQTLSDQTGALVEPAARQILAWVGDIFPQSP
jgi:hydrogenase maturation protease